MDGGRDGTRRGASAADGGTRPGGASWAAFAPKASEPPYAASIDWVRDTLDVDPARGLSQETAAERLHRYGPNRIGTESEMSALAILLAQFRGPIVWLLGAAGALSLWMGDLVEAAAIFGVLLVNGAVGFFNEWRARSSMAALRKLTRTTARVRREGSEARVDAETLVPGDVVVVEAGDLVPADLRLAEAADMEADESTLTGESVPVAKTLDPLAPGAALGDRTNMAFRGTSITRGRGVGIVVATGHATQLGEIAELLAGAEDEAAPLERRLARLGQVLAVAVSLLAIAIAAAGLAAGRPWLEMVETAIALAVAAVPEGLPIIATLALARGMWRMAERNVLVNRLSSVETLGSTNVLLTDKTGTLTQNRMSAERLVVGGREVPVPAGGAVPPAGPALDRALEVMVLCNEALLGRDGGEDLGDPMEVALLRAAVRFGRDPGAVRETYALVRTIAFDADTKMMATVHRGEGGCLRVALKGAPEAVLARAGGVWTPEGMRAFEAGERDALAEQATALAERGLRLLGLGDDRVGEAAEARLDGFAFLGFVCLLDPPRGDVAEAIGEFRRAGIRIVMVTGDHAATARKIASDVGLVEDPGARVCGAEEARDALARSDGEREGLLGCRIFARVPPRTKLDLVALHQADNAVVAMTGDGVNDAPALRKADIGVAMGRRGTQVAAEASDIILRDDAFASIVHAVREGRVIYRNIQLFVRYLLACNLSEIIVIGLAMAAGMALPLLPLQILFLNLVTDVFPALAIGFGEGPRDVMRRRPRPRDEPLLGPARWADIATGAALIAAATLAVFATATAGFGAEQGNTAAFATLCLAQLWFVFTLHPHTEPLWANELTRNRSLWLAVLFSAGLMLAAVHGPVLPEVLSLAPPEPALWLMILAGSAAPLAVTEALAALRALRSLPDNG